MNLDLNVDPKTEPIPVLSVPEEVKSPKQLGMLASLAVALLCAVVVGCVWYVGAEIYQGKFGSQPTTPGRAQSSATAPAAVTPQSEAAPVAPAPTAWVPVDSPSSLVVRRGTEVVLSADHVDEIPAVDNIVPPKDGSIAWLNNEGTGVGTDMGPSWIVGHNIVGTDSDPFGLLGNVQPGDVIEITNHSGGTVYFRVNDGIGVDPGLGVRTVSKQVNGGQILDYKHGVAKTVYLGTCNNDGDSNILVTASLIQ